VAVPPIPAEPPVVVAAREPTPTARPAERPANDRPSRLVMVGTVATILFAVAALVLGIIVLLQSAGHDGAIVGSVVHLTSLYQAGPVSPGPV
jgi:hypothetical protein